MKMSEFRPGMFVKAKFESTDYSYLGLYKKNKYRIKVLDANGAVKDINIEACEEDLERDYLELPERFPRSSILTGLDRLETGDLAKTQASECFMVQKCSSRTRYGETVKGQEETSCESCIFHPNHLEKYIALEREARTL